MSPEENKAIEGECQALLGQLKVAESALRNGLHTHGFGSNARTHMERALAHICEAYVAINEPTKNTRTVQQLADDLNRIQQVTEEVQRKHHKSQHI
jgi:hypothetical protein